MRLLLDIGNTAVKWMLTGSGGMEAQGRFEHATGDFSALADAAWSRLAPPRAVVVVNVAGERIAQALADFAAQRWACPVTFVSTQAAAFGVRNAYHVQGDLGADRWVAMIAAHRLSGGTVCVIDCGTAITLDVVAADGQHRGGLILPGAALLAGTLQDNTQGISLQRDAAVSGLLARGTAAGVSGGALYLLAATIDRLVADLERDGGESIDVIMTGGDAERLMAQLATPVRHVPDLVFQGLMLFSDGDK